MTPAQLDRQFQRIGRLSLAIRNLQMMNAANCYAIHTITLKSADGLAIEVDLTNTGPQGFLIDGIIRELQDCKSEMLRDINDYE